VVRRPEQVAELEALGADVVLVDGDDLPERVREVTGGGAPAAIDAVSGPLGARMAAALAPGGTLVAYGRLSQLPMPLDSARLLFLGASVRGFWLARWLRERPREHVAGALATMLGLMADGTVDPPVEATYDLADVRAACAHAERPGRAGKVILTG
jgi:NADPH:quinone reductase-like Zn-dependent oxidoreductase